jgi:hypothetical protein
MAGQDFQATPQVISPTTPQAQRFTKLAIGASTFILTSTGTAPQWSDPTSISVNTATNIAGGGANQIVFNTGSGATSFITAPTVGSTYLEWSGSAFQWSSNPRYGDIR